MPHLAEQFEISHKIAQRDINYLRDRLRAPMDHDPTRRGWLLLWGGREGSSKNTRIRPRFPELNRSGLVETFIGVRP
jgi:hypothetical protein